MKKNLLQLLLLLIVSAACGPKKQTDSATRESLLQAPADSMAIDLAKHNHRISFDSAAMLISDLFTIPSLGNLASTYALGGTFPVSQFNVGKDSSGVILWFCFKPGKTPELFMALEHLKEYDIKNPPREPVSKMLSMPDFTFKDSNSQHDVPAIERYLESQVSTKNASEPIDNATAVRHIHSFDSLLATLPEKYNAYPFSYFQRDDGGVFEKFLDQARPNGFVRYYFAYDETKVPNRIKLVLVAVDQYGKNIIKSSGGEAILMDQSWPPPPWQ